MGNLIQVIFEIDKNIETSTSRNHDVKRRPSANQIKAGGNYDGAGMLQPIRSKPVETYDGAGKE